MEIRCCVTVAVRSRETVGPACRAYSLCLRNHLQNNERFLLVGRSVHQDDLLRNIFFRDDLFDDRLRLFGVGSAR